MPIITISRGTFTGGEALAESLAEQLGYRCIGREEILDAATASYGVPVEKLAAAMEKHHSFWERLVGERDHYLGFLRAALLERVRQDNLVYHGYLGNLVLEDISHVIRVRVIEDIESRIKTAMERHKLARSEAIARIKRVDEDRAEWTRFLHGVDWLDASLYDAVLNLTRMGIPAARDVVARMAESEAFKPTAQSLAAMEDLALGSRVWATMATNPLTVGGHLKVTAHDGVVTVTGSATSWEVVDAIPLVAGGLEGVQRVKCDVRVTPLMTEQM